MLTLISATVLALAASTLATPAPGPSTPLARRGPTFLPIHAHHDCSTLSKRDGVGASLTDFRLSTYFALNVSVGTPPQAAPYILDVASGAPVLVGKCTGNMCSSARWDVFAAGSSKSYKKLGTGSVRVETLRGGPTTEAATWGSDTFSMSGYNATVPFAQMDGTTVDVGTTLALGPAGRLPLAPSYSSADILSAGKVDLNGTQTFLRQVAAKWDDKQFGLFFRRRPTTMETGNPTTTRNLNAGQLALGGLNPGLSTGDMSYVDTVNASWTIPLEAIEVNGKTIDLRSSANSSASGNTTGLDSPRGLPVTLSSMARGFVFPQSVCNRLLEAVPGWTKQKVEGFPDELYQLPSKNYSLTFTFGGLKYAMEPDDWTYTTGSIKGSAGPVPVAAMQCTAEESGGAVGLAFLQTVYTAFRLEPTMQVGFAKAVDDATADRLIGKVTEALPQQPKSGAWSMQVNAVLAAAAGLLGYVFASC